MAFALDLATDDLPEEVRRALDERIAAACEQLAAAAASDAAAEPVHEARKDLKKARSLVRLVRTGMDPAERARERDALRDTASGLGGARDADALVECVDRLEERYAEDGRGPLLGGLRAAVAERAQAAHAGDGAGVDEAREALAAARARVAALDLERVRPRTLAEGLARTYARGVDTFRAADADPTAERLHEWRKRVKDLWYQHKLVAAAWPAVLDAYAEEAKALSKVLGDDHDLHQLELALDGDLPAAAARDVPLARALAGARRGELLVAARAGGERLHAEAPKAFRRRVVAVLAAPVADPAVPLPG